MDSPQMFRHYGGVSGLAYVRRYKWMSDAGLLLQRALVSKPHGQDFIQLHFAVADQKNRLIAVEIDAID